MEFSQELPNLAILSREGPLVMIAPRPLVDNLVVGQGRLLRGE